MAERKSINLETAFTELNLLLKWKTHNYLEEDDSIKKGWNF